MEIYIVVNQEESYDNCILGVYTSIQKAIESRGLIYEINKNSFYDYDNSSFLDIFKEILDE